MQGNGKLKLISTERRNTYRSDPPRKAAVSGYIGPHFVQDLTVLSIGFGQVTLLVPISIPTDSLNHSEEQISLVIGDDHLITGNWLISYVRTENNNIIFTLTHPNVRLVQSLSNTLTGEHFLRADYMRIFNLDSSNDIEEISKLFTDLVDYGRLVRCRICTENDTQISSFNFESKQKSLFELSFNFVQLSNLEKGQKVTIEFSFLSIRYVLSTQVKDIDKDFNLIITSVPSVIVALTARRYNRISCSLPCIIKLNSDFFGSSLTSISATGCEVFMDTKIELTINSLIHIEIKDFSIVIPAVIRSIRGNRIGLSFVESTESILDIRRIYNFFIKEPSVLRNTSNYDKFIQLYKDVGYGPDSSFSDWENQTKESWILQDRNLPGNTIGTLIGNRIVNSFGILPISQLVAGTHSLAMHKTVDSVGHFLELVNHNLSNLDLIPGIKYYFGSVRTSSRFSTRLYTIFESQSKPSSLRTFSCLSLNPSSKKRENLTIKYRIRHWDSTKDKLPESLTFLQRLFAKPHDLLSEVHSFEDFAIEDQGGNLVAFVKKSTMQKMFTAVDIFRAIFCFALIKEIDFQGLYNLLENQKGFNSHFIEIFPVDLKTVPAKLESERVQDDVFYFLFSKDEMGALLANMYKAAWRVLKKYGDDAISYMDRALH